jgi:hypothetical protein
MKAPRGKRTGFIPVLGNAVLALLGVAIALGLMELVLRTNPNWAPREVRVNPPVRRVQALIDETYDVRLSDGDLFHLMRGTIAPLSPDGDMVVAHVHMTTDAHGFRNSLPELATYDVVAVGDSFTRASGVANAWPQELADATGMEVLNLADVGAGPQEELALLRQYGLAKRPQWVILAYFEGNDLYDAAAYEQASPFILTRFAKYMLEQGLEAWRESRGSDAHAAAVAASYRYPITVTIDDTGVEMAFFSYYMGWLSVSGKAIEASQNYRLVTETILRMRELSEVAGGHFLLVYMPTKEHVYLSFLNDAETLARVITDVPTVELDGAGFLQFTNQAATRELLRQHMDDQAHLLADFAAAHSIVFLDLTPTFQEAAATGAELYYPFDTHWNQRGHDLAAQTIATYIENLESR